MAESDKVTKKATPPKGGRKGGTIFPRMNLKQALEYSEKLVGKTHTGPQAATTILPGVFGNAGPEGKVRASALKQYGLLEGPPSAYQATGLARKIAAAPVQERPEYVQVAFLNPKLFKEIFETFHNDTVQKPKIRQRALGLAVHPDSVDECVEFFMDSAVTASLGTRSGDGISLAQARVTSSEPGNGSDDEENPAEPVQSENTDKDDDLSKTGTEQARRKDKGRTQTAAVNVTLNVDSSSDPEKLEKQLKLLKQYGVI